MSRLCDERPGLVVARRIGAGWRDFSVDSDAESVTFHAKRPNGCRMATQIPTLNSCLPRMTAGEKRFAQRLEQKLEDDYLLWYDVPVVLMQSRPDFVVFHPG